MLKKHACVLLVSFSLFSSPSIFAALSREDANRILDRLSVVENLLHSGSSDHCTQALGVLKDLNTRYGADAQYGEMFGKQHNTLKENALQKLQALKPQVQTQAPVQAAAAGGGGGAQVQPQQQPIQQQQQQPPAQQQVAGHGGGGAQSRRPVQTRVMQADSFAGVGEWLDPRALLLVDIDATLLHKYMAINPDTTTRDLLVKNEAFLNCLQRAGIEEIRLATLSTLRVQNPRLTEANLPQLFESLTQMGVKIVPFTIRGASTATDTVQQLRALGLNFEQWNQRNGLTPPDRFLRSDFFAGACFVNGIIFANDNDRQAGHKDLALQALIHELNSTGRAPSQIAFFDDNDVHVRQIQDLLPTSPIPLSVIHYTGGKFVTTVQQVRQFYETQVPNFTQLYGRCFDQAFAHGRHVP